MSANPAIGENAAGPEQHAAPERLRVWDWPTRVFHWALVAAVLAAFITGKLGGPWMVWHGKAGLAIVGLIAFRVMWGFIGPSHARFIHFAPSPARLRAYLRGRWRGIGHNPLGALSVFALLGVLALQAGTGLFGNDDIDFMGPLAALVSGAWSSRLTGWHHQLSDVLLALIALHIAAIAFYVLLKKQDLLKPMLGGSKTPQGERPRAAFNRAALAVSLLVALAAIYAASVEHKEARKESPTAPQPSRSPGW